jgi:hypothetical protein
MSRTVHWLLLGACALTAAMSSAQPAGAGNCGPFATDCVPSVFDRQPFNPSYCNPSNPYACTPRWGGALGQDLLLTIQSSKVGEYAKPDHELNTIDDLFAALRSCWLPPEADSMSPGLQMTVRLSFKRDGDAFGLPRVTYATRGISPHTRETYRDAINNALARCTPLPLTKGLGGAIAGRPINIRYVDDRDEQQGQHNDQH